MPDLPGKLAALSQEQRKELRRRLQQRGARETASEEDLAANTGIAIEKERTAGNVTAQICPPEKPGNGLELSLLFFSGDGSTMKRDKYELLLESARFADKHNFCAVWIPERHFQNFGGLYPNPSVLAAAISTITERIRIRAGSIVLPLHNPIRVAEEWSAVDNLSGGRVELSFAAGYHPGDFILAPQNYQKRKEIMFENIEIIRKLWSGDPMQFRGVNNEQMSVRILPIPLQPELPLWITSSSSVETWIKAGEIGANILSGVSGISDQPFDDITRKIYLYRQSLAAHGYDPHSKKVALMLHTYVERDMESIREKVKGPLSSYLRTFIAQDEYLTTNDTKLGIESIKQQDRNALISFAVDRFISTSSLIGTPEKCVEMLARLDGIGINEVACFIDFGLDTQSVLDGLGFLDESIAKYSRN